MLSTQVNIGMKSLWYALSTKTSLLQSLSILESQTAQKF